MRVLIDRNLFYPLAVLLGLVLAVPGSVRAQEGRPPLHHVPASACAECHQVIFQQWLGSMHAQSTALKDPIHGVFYGMLIGDPTKEGETHKKSGKYPVCLRCHAPNAARDGKTKLDALPAYSEGVNCVACHTMSTFKGIHGENGKLRLGNMAYEYDDGQLHGPHGAFNGMNPAPSPGSGSPEPAVNPFPHVNNPELFKTSAVCLGCHGQRKNPKGVPVCATGPEVIASGNTVTCQSCHMSVSNGFANHTMGGGHDLAMLRRAVVLNVQAKAGDQGVDAKVTLHNTLAHNFPTGAPFRNVVVKVTAFNGQGMPVWQNFKNNPFKEDGKAVLMLKLTDDKGTPMPPPKASKIAADTRMAPNERRTLDYAIAAKGVKMVRAELFYNLLPAPILKKVGPKLPPPLKTPRLINRVEARL